VHSDDMNDVMVPYCIILW